MDDSFPEKAGCEWRLAGPTFTPFHSPDAETKASSGYTGQPHEQSKGSRSTAMRQKQVGEAMTSSRNAQHQQLQ